MQMSSSQEELLISQALQSAS